MRMSSSPLSKKASSTSFVVAESTGAVEALKDQLAGLCQWDYALRSLYKSAKLTGRAVPVYISSSSSQAAVNGSSSAARAGGRASRPTQSEEEKLHKAYHLVCWGPN